MVTASPSFTLTVYRFDPEVDAAPRWQAYAVPHLPQMTVLDAVFHVQNELDETLAFRCSCRVGMCGSCGMTIDGRPALACQTALGSRGRAGRPAGRGVEPPPPMPSTGGPLFETTVAPLRHLPVIKDLVVDMAPFFERYARVVPHLVPKEPAAPPAVVPPGSAVRGRLDDHLECITCGLCYAACGMVGRDPSYLGPAALTRAYTLVADPRDAAGAQRLAAVGGEGGVFGCRTQLACTDHCPKHLAPTRAIQRLKGRVVRRRVRAALRWWSEDE